MELGARLIEIHAYDEALPCLEAMLAREPEHCQALFLLAQCQRGLGKPSEAVVSLRKLIARHPSWSDYEAWPLLVEACHASGDSAGALTHCRDLARIAPSLEHTHLLAENLLKAGERVEARKILEQALEDYRFASGPSRSRDRKWVGRAKQLLKQMG